MWGLPILAFFEGAGSPSSSAPVSVPAWSTSSCCLAECSDKTEMFVKLCIQSRSFAYKLSDRLSASVTPHYPPQASQALLPALSRFSLQLQPYAVRILSRASCCKLSHARRCSSHACIWQSGRLCTWTWMAGCALGHECDGSTLWHWELETSKGTYQTRTHWCHKL